MRVSKVHSETEHDALRALVMRAGVCRCDSAYRNEPFDRRIRMRTAFQTRR